MPLCSGRRHVDRSWMSLTKWPSVEFPDIVLYLIDYLTTYKVVPTDSGVVCSFPIFPGHRFSSPTGNSRLWVCWPKTVKSHACGSLSSVRTPEDNACIWHLQIIEAAKRNSRPASSHYQVSKPSGMYGLAIPKV